MRRSFNYSASLKLHTLGCRLVQSIRFCQYRISRSFSRVYICVLKVIAFIIITCSVAEAASFRVTVRYDPNWISRSYLQSVLDYVNFIYLRDLRIRLKFRVISDSRVDHSLYAQDLTSRFSELYAWKLVLKKNTKRIQLVVVGPYFDSTGHSYGAGLFSQIVLAVIRQTESASGADRFSCDWVTSAHELAHALGANHVNQTDSIMHPDACRYATEGVDMTFTEKTKVEISRY